MRTIGDTIKLLREERRISQQALADGLNIKRNTISMWESDKRVPSDEMKEQICDFFNVDLNFLYGITDCRNSVREHPEGFIDTFLTDHEREHLDIYRFLDDKGQHTVDTVTQMEYERVKGGSTATLKK